MVFLESLKTRLFDGEDLFREIFFAFKDEGIDREFENLALLHSGFAFETGFPLAFFGEGGFVGHGFVEVLPFVGGPFKKKEILITGHLFLFEVGTVDIVNVQI